MFFTRDMGERGLSSAVSLGILMIILFTSASMFVAAYGNYYGETSAAREEKGERLSNKIQTDISIENTLYDSANENLEVTIVNSGSTVLDTSSVYIFLEGEMVLEDNISKRQVDGISTDVWIPKDNLKITVENVASKPSRIKTVVDYGISDYFERIEEV